MIPFSSDRRVPGRAETDEEKKAILDHVFEAWKKVPTMRLGQLIVAMVPGVWPNTHLFYIEDDKLVAALDESTARVENGVINIP